ncbi:hypothetical protein KP509_01G114800 [Ceratopteris richardii]|uniref:Thioredoxin domain-containing protein n=1 Tax=Ceratopteris richardii TaxID=49495 RepID=A0A8T2VNA9_CERRI|nr:hypothetical protein KP509_01G114800 [Ceratopteris richardii]
MDSSSPDENGILHFPSSNAYIAFVDDCIVSNRLLVTLMEAPWSEPSKAVYSIFVQLREVFPDVIFSKMDVEETKDVASLMFVRIVPSVIFVLEGKEVARIKKTVPYELLQQTVLSLLKKQQS